MKAPSLCTMQEEILGCLSSAFWVFFLGNIQGYSIEKNRKNHLEIPAHHLDGGAAFRILGTLLENRLVFFKAITNSANRFD